MSWVKAIFVAPTSYDLYITLKQILLKKLLHSNESKDILMMEFKEFFNSLSYDCILIRYREEIVSDELASQTILLNDFAVVVHNIYL